VVSRKKEIAEARTVASEVLGLLAEVEKTLKSASNWGFYDMLGGGFFSSLIKHKKINRAEALLGKVHDGLIRLQEELGDVNLSVDPSVRISDFQRFMDIAFDNIISDWMTQSKIRDSLSEVGRIQEEIRKIITTLNKVEKELN
jgi:hypothetical protein